MQEKDRGEVLQQALTRHREIIDLVYYHVKSVGECAQILGIPAATVKTRMFYAHKKLAEFDRVVPHYAHSIDRWDDHRVERMSQPRDERQDDLFGPPLEKIINLRHRGCGLRGSNQMNRTFS